MLTKDDLKSIADLMDRKFDAFAIIVKNSLDSKPDREEVESSFNSLEARLTRRMDILEYKIVGAHDRRIELLEDNMRQVKSRLKMR